MYEILEYLLHQEFRFVRRDSLNLHYPDVGNSLFLASVFGIFPDRIPQSIANDLKRSLRYGQKPCDLDNYYTFFDPAILYPNCGRKAHIHSNRE